MYTFGPMVMLRPSLTLLDIFTIWIRDFYVVSYTIFKENTIIYMMSFDKVIKTIDIKKFTIIFRRY